MMVDGIVVHLIFFLFLIFFVSLVLSLIHPFRPKKDFHASGSGGRLKKKRKSGPADVEQELAAALAAGGEVGDVGVGGEGLGDFAGGLDLTDLDEAVAGLGDGATNSISTFGLALGADDVGLALLLGALDDEAGALGVLLGDLLLLDGLGELLAVALHGSGILPLRSSLEVIDLWGVSQ